MQLISNFFPITSKPSASVVTIGNFDGVHAGHQALIRTLCQIGKRMNLPTAVIIFEPQPAEFFGKTHIQGRLTSLREKLNCLKSMGVTWVYCLKFNRSLAQMTAQEFAQSHVFDTLNCCHLLVGEDFRFGIQRTGTTQLLQEMGRIRGIEVQIFPDHVQQGIRVSSTAIRKALAEGKLELAKTLLNRPYSMMGRVTRGNGKGREWGVPTANLALRKRKPPLSGVYCVEVKWGDTLYEGVANLGIRPTLDGTRCILEVHLLNFDQSLYGQRLEVFFLHKLRDEVKFDNLQALITQIQLDVALAKQYFKQR